MKLAYAEIQDCQVILRMDARSLFRQGRITIPIAIAYPLFTKKRARVRDACLVPV